MNRRNFIQLLSQGLHASFPDNPPSTKGLEPYTGGWGFAEASHLLRRTTFGPSLQLLNQLATQDLDTSLSIILADVALPSPPLNAGFADASTPIGDSWIGKPLNPVNTSAHQNSRRDSIFAWNREVIFLEGASIREKMTLFWHNHFATETNTSPEASYRHITLLRTHALGNFRQLTKDITVDARMLKYLNGNENIKAEPNENYARELLELFTVGKGPLIGPGDYSNYTEQDVIEGAKILTGWKVNNANSTDVNEPMEVIFRPDKHTLGNKTLSAHFNNAVIAENGEDEYKDFIDIIFQQPAVAQFIVTKIYRFFVYYDITPTVQNLVIDPLAQILIDNDYNIKPVLETLFKSEHFFDTPTRGCLIKHPIDFLESMAKQLNWAQPENLAAKYLFNKKFTNFQIDTGMHYFKPPSVAGWKAYYQPPTFHKIWINPATYQKRNSIKNIMLSNGITAYGVPYKVNLIGVIQLTSTPSNPVVIIDELTQLFLPLPASNSLKAYLKTKLIPGLPDYEWTMEYNNYLNNPDDTGIKEAIEIKIRTLLRSMLELPEFHLS